MHTFLDGLNEIGADQYASPQCHLECHGALRLDAGLHRRRIVLHGLRGTADNPIVLTGTLDGAPQDLEPHGAVFIKGSVCSEPDHATDRRTFKTWFQGAHDEAAYRTIAEHIARRREAGGHFPTQAETADQAIITLIDCQHVVLRDIGFVDCWPTAIYLDNCQFITLDRLRFEGGTYAIGANGSNTHDIVVENCRFRCAERIWRDVEWSTIHGYVRDGTAVAEDDNRHFDGDFFRAWGVFGNVTIRNNWIGDAFNGIHFFARAAQRRRDLKGDVLDKKTEAYSEGGIGTSLDVQGAINVLIENNVFYRIADNCIEPEDFAYNWVVRHNRIDNCYRPFSLEMKQTGWIYIYGNAGHLVEKPGPRKVTPSLFKVSKQQNGGGPVYVVHNSWHLHSRHLSKGMLRGLKLFNNAIEFKVARAKVGLADGEIGGGFLGAGTWAPISDQNAPDPNMSKNFSRRWDKLDISVDGNLSNDVFTQGAELGTSLYHEKGYTFGRNNAFARNTLLNSEQALFELTKHARKAQTPVSWTLELPLRFGEKIARSFPVAAETCGAIMEDGTPYSPKLPGIPAEADFPFLPETPHGRVGDDMEQKIVS